MTNATSEITVEMLDAFTDAWNRHGAHAIMSFMSDDCVFEASAGPVVSGRRFVSHEAVRAGFVDVWTNYPDAHWETPDTSCTAIGASPSGPSPGRGLTGSGSKCTEADYKPEIDYGEEDRRKRFDADELRIRADRAGGRELPSAV